MSWFKIVFSWLFVVFFILITNTGVFANNQCQTQMLSEEDKARLIEFTSGTLEQIRSAEAAYYAKNGHYDDFVVLTDASYLDSRFSSGVFGENDVWITIEFFSEEKQEYSVTAEIKGLYGFMSLSEGGEILDYITDPLPYALGVASTIRASEAAYYAEKGHYGDLAELAANGYLDDRFASGVFDYKGFKATANLVEDGQRYIAIVYMMGIDGFVTVDETGEIRG